MQKNDDGCWNWKGKLHTNGYGVFWLQKGVYRLAHRMAWLYTFGEIPDGLCVCHHCDNRCCVNPAHLFIGTHQDNMADMVRKGRHNPSPKVTPEIVRGMRKAKMEGLSNSQIGRLFGVNAETARYVCNRTRWAHVPD